MKTKLSVFLTVCIVLLHSLSSCSFYMKEYPKEISNKAKNLKPAEDKALVYVFRRSAMGFAVGLYVNFNGSKLAEFYPKYFYLCALEPGKYVFTGIGENEDDLVLNVEANKKYYINVAPRMGFASARVKLIPLDAEKGEKKLKKCKMLGANSQADKFLWLH